MDHLLEYLLHQDLPGQGGQSKVFTNPNVLAELETHPLQVHHVQGIRYMLQLKQYEDLVPGPLQPIMGLILSIPYMLVCAPLLN